MPKKTTNKSQTKKASVKLGAESNSAIKVESKIDVKPVINESKLVETKAAVQEEFKNIEVKAVVPEETKKEEVKAKTKSVAKTAKTEVKKEKKENSKKTATKTKVSSKVKADVKTSKKVQDTTEQKEVKKINYLELLGDEAIKVVITDEKKTGKNYPIKVALKNFGFLKTVKVKYTEDGWNTEIEKELTFKEQDDNNIEEWSTIIEVSTKDKANFQYVVSYEVNDQIYWDNNCGSNYLF